MNKLLTTLSLGLVLSSTLVTSSQLPYVYQPLKLGQIKPTGWLYNELRLQGDGLAGQFQNFWEPMYNSQWLGGSSTFEDWFEIL